MSIIVIIMIIIMTMIIIVVIIMIIIIYCAIGFLKAAGLLLTPPLPSCRIGRKRRWHMLREASQRAQNPLN